MIRDLDKGKCRN